MASSIINASKPNPNPNPVCDLFLLNKLVVSCGACAIVPWICRVVRAFNCMYSVTIKAATLLSCKKFSCIISTKWNTFLELWDSNWERSETIKEMWITFYYPSERNISVHFMRLLISWSIGTYRYVCLRDFWHVTTERFPAQLSWRLPKITIEMVWIWFTAQFQKSLLSESGRNVLYTIPEITVKWKCFPTDFHSKERVKECGKEVFIY